MKTPLVILAALYLLMFWSDSFTYAPGMDSMTYGAVSKHMLATGEWAVPHYAQQAYANFFQHPPLALWMMAATMKTIGWIAGPSAATADWVLKLLPSLMGALCALGVYLWGKRLRGEWFAFLATLVLLTSTRFVKYSKGFMLDPFLATFSLWAVYLACASQKRALSGRFVAGLCVAAAFLSKGLFAFAPFVVILIRLGAELCTSDQKKRRFASLACFLIGVAFPMILWFAFGGATEYLAHYYTEHVAGRIGSHPLHEHFAPLVNFGKVYWPWLPLFFMGGATILRAEKIHASFTSFVGALKKDEVVILLGACAFLAGFSLAGSFLEQYHTATYPFAALVVAAGIPATWERFRAPTEKTVLALLVGFAIFMAIFPNALRSQEYRNPIRAALQQARTSCKDSKIERIVISTSIAEIWYALAMGTWNTDWDARSDSSTKGPLETNSQILLATKTDMAPGWIPTAIEIADLRIYRAPTISDCR